MDDNLEKVRLVLVVSFCKDSVEVMIRSILIKGAEGINATQIFTQEKTCHMCKWLRGSIGMGIL